MGININVGSCNLTKNNIILVPAYLKKVAVQNSNLLLTIITRMDLPRKYRGLWMIDGLDNTTANTHTQKTKKEAALML